MRAARECAQRWARARREVRLAVPPRGMDAADLGERRMKADVRELVETAKLVPFQIAASTDVTPAWPAPLDLPALSRAERRRIRHIVRDWLPEGEVTLLAGHGGAGKSLIALLLAVCIALGMPWYGIPTERRRVVYVSAEDGRDVLHWRLDRICAYLGVDMADLDGWLSIIDASAIDAELIIDTRDGPMLTRMYGALHESIGDAQVLIIDGASDTYGANEIVRRSVRQFIRALRRLIPPDGAVLVLAHVDKAIARGRESGDHYSGSTAWNNSVRARWALRAEGDGLMLTVEKANHAQAGAEIRLRWDPQAHLPRCR